nr:hypothetical protein [Candidatus Sigynarchaeota archaeon]
MKSRDLVLGIIGVFIFTALPIVAAHVPVGSGNNDHIDTALEFDTPTKSWVIYEHLNSSAKYYHVDLDAGQRIVVNTFIPRREYSSGFVPSIVIMGPGLANSTTPPPAYIEKPVEEGGPGIYNGFYYVQGVMPAEPAYEPFTPASDFYTTNINWSINITGHYYIAVLANNMTGDFGMAEGYIEQFSFTDWVTIPFSLVTIHLWEGQNWFVIFLPLIGVIAVGIIFMVTRQVKQKKSPATLQGWLIGLAGLVIVGSGAMTLQQMVIAVVGTPVAAELLISLIFVALPILLGAVLFKNAFFVDQSFLTKDRIKIAVYGGLAIAIWAGFWVATGLAIAAAFVGLKRKAAADKK